MSILLFTRAATLKIYDDLKKFIFIFSVTTQALYVGYLTYALLTGAGILFANIAFLLLSVAYSVLLLIYGRRQKEKDKDKIEAISKIYRWTRIVIKAGTLAATVYGIHIATTKVTFIAVLLAALTTIAWVLSILFELVRIVFEKYYELIEAAILKDTYPIRKLLMKAEAPISHKLLVKRVVQSYGIARAGSRIQDYMDKIFISLKLAATTQNGEKFYWNPDQKPSNYNIIRISSEGDTKRDTDDIPLKEAYNAVHYVLSKQISLSEDDLIREAARLMGYTRKGAVVTSIFSSAIESAVRTGRIKKDRNDHYVLN